MLNTKEHYDLLAQFEKAVRHGRFDKEAKQDWGRGIIYQDGRVNEMFKVYRLGYAHGKAVERLDA